MSTVEVPEYTSPLKQARLAVGLSQTELAKRIKVCRPSVTRWEAGRTKPDPIYIPRLARVLRKSSGDVVDMLFVK